MFEPTPSSPSIILSDRTYLFKIGRIVFLDRAVGLFRNGGESVHGKSVFRLKPELKADLDVANGRPSSHEPHASGHEPLNPKSS